jgi:metal-responsive CopG/Arc/MetJ family transcriptional regulator
MKAKNSLSLPEDLLGEIDAEAEQTRRSRSQIVEVWLRLASRRRAAAKLDRDTRAYYEKRTAEQRADDDEWTELAGREARDLEYD